MDQLKLAVQDRIRAAALRELLSVADAAIVEGREVKRIRSIARGLCVLTDLERSQVVDLLGFDCCV